MNYQAEQKTEETYAEPIAGKIFKTVESRAVAKIRLQEIRLRSVQSLMIIYDGLEQEFTDITVDKRELIYITGEVFTCRSRLQKYIFDEKNTLPFSTEERNILIHNGTIVIEGRWKVEAGKLYAYHQYLL